MVANGFHNSLIIHYRLYMAVHNTKGRSASETKRVNKALESVIQRDICDWLEQGGYFFWRSNNVPVFAMSNDGVRRFRSLPKHTPRGLPDIIVIQAGKFIALEVKRPGAKLRPEQADFGLRAIKAGGSYHVVHSVDELKELKEFGGWRMISVYKKEGSIAETED